MMQPGLFFLFYLSWIRVIANFPNLLSWWPYAIYLSFSCINFLFIANLFKIVLLYQFIYMQMT